MDYVPQSKDIEYLNGLKTQDKTIYSLQETHFNFNDTHRKVKDGKIYFRWM